VHVASVAIIFLLRCLLIALFLPFSALDKILNTRQAVAQAEEVVRPQMLATLFIVVGGAIEVVMSLAILTGFMDRLAALILGVYCLTTAALWKCFWKVRDFRLTGASKGREVFWDFLKNTALAGAFFLLAFGNDAAGVRRFFFDPLASTHPYETTLERGR
jgi:putative oxidoreductase